MKQEELEKINAHLEKKFAEVAKKLDKEFHRGFRLGMIFATILWVIALLAIVLSLIR